MKTKPILIAAGCILILLSILSYISAPSAVSFEWASVNPVSVLSGLAFLFSFGFGFPVAVSVILILLLLIAAILLLGKAIQKIFFKHD